MISETLFSVLIWSIIAIGWIGFIIIAVSLVRDGFLGLKGFRSRSSEGKEPGDGESSR